MTLGERFAGSTVGSALATRATSDPGAAYLRFGGEVLTYGRVEAEAEALAAALSELGLAAGDRLALVLTPRPEFSIATFAAAKLGLTIVPLSPRLTGACIPSGWAESTGWMGPGRPEPRCGGAGPARAGAPARNSL